MKKIVYVLCICMFALLVTACNDLSAPEHVKTEFKLNEVALIDNYEIQLIKNEKNNQYKNNIATNGQYIILTFKIKNNNKTTQFIDENNFSLTINNQVYKPTDVLNMTIDANKTQEYTIIYDVPVNEDYELIFYSGVVTNNIEFEIEF